MIQTSAVNRWRNPFAKILSAFQKHKNVTGGISSSHRRFKRLIQRRYSIFKQKILYDSRQYTNEAG